MGRSSVIEMKERSFIESSMSVYRRFRHLMPSLLTTNLAARRPLLVAPPAAKLLLDTLERTRAETGMVLLAYVLMPDHVHLVTAPSATCSLSRFMQLFKGRFSREWNARCGAAGSVWRSRFDERALTNEESLLRAIEYVHWNPVKAGLSVCPEEHPWSSAAGMDRPCVALLADYLGLGQAEACPPSEITTHRHPG